MNPSTHSWLTPKRLRAHALILGVAVWSLYLWTIATPGLRDRNGNLKGTDFLHFYTLGVIAAENREVALYDVNAQAALAAQRVPDAAGIRYLPLYPPQVSILFAPLSFLPYGSALVAWWFLIAAIYGFCCYGVWRTCPNLWPYAGTVAIATVAFPAFFNLIAWGQTSALALACFTLALLFLRQRSEFLAGICLGCLIFKPQLGIAACIVFIATGAWRMIFGGILSAGTQLAIGIFYYRTGAFRQWLRVLMKVPQTTAAFEPRPYQTHCLRTFWEMLFPWSGVAVTLYLITAIIVLGVLIVAWRPGRRVPLELRYSLLLLATVLISPHLTVYDLVILAPAILLLADWLLGQPENKMGRRMKTLLYLVYLLPLIGYLSRWTHLQLSVIAMAGLYYLVWRASRDTAADYSRQASAVQAQA